MTRFVLDTNVFVRAIRNTEVRAELAAWQRAMASHIYQNAAVVGEILTGAACEAVRQRWHARWAAPAEPLARVRASSTIVFSRPGAGSTAARLHGCTAARLHGCTAARLHGCTAARLHGCTAARLHGCTAARLHGCTAARLHGVTYNTVDFERIARVSPGVRYVLPFP